MWNNSWVDNSRTILKSLDIAELGGKYERAIPGLVEKQARVIAAASQNDGIGVFSLISFAFFANNIGEDRKIKQLFQEMRDQGIICCEPDAAYRRLEVNIALMGVRYRRFDISNYDSTIEGTTMNIISKNLQPIHDKLLPKKHHDRQALVNPQDEIEAQFGPDHLFDPLFQIALENRFP